jgi:ATP-dependent DNA helicase 2 subunit 1
MSYNDDDIDNDEFNDEEFNFTSPMGSYRDSIIFLVDCTKSMFARSDDASHITLFQECMSVLQSMYQNKIYSSDKDYLGVVFFGTDKNNTDDDFPHVNMIQKLDQPSAERIQQIEMFSRDLNKFDDNYGHSDDFELDKVLWWCSNMFSSVTQKLDSKRIFLFTRKSHPHENKKLLEKLAKIKAKDLIDVGIKIEIIPVVLKGETFDYSKFYADFLMLSEDDISLLPNPSESIEELKSNVRAKDHKRRPTTHLKLSLGENLNLSCSVFNLVREATKPSKIKLDRKTNTETKSVTRRYAPDTGEILFSSDIKLGMEVANKIVAFEQDEIKSIKKFGLPGKFFQ